MGLEALICLEFAGFRVGNEKGRERLSLTGLEWGFG